MSIELQCTQCGKTIRAPDNAGGRYGRCPYCAKQVYIPPPEDQLEPYDLAPVDESEEKKAERLRRESIEYVTHVAHHSAEPSSGDPPDSAARGQAVDVAAEVERFILAMRDSRLDEADQAVDRLKRAGRKAVDHVQGLIVDEMPPQFENVPPPLLKGFLKALSVRIG